MQPSRHIIVSIPLSIAVGYFTKSIIASGLCFFSGVLIDIDHLIEYVIHFGLRTFNLREIYQACEKMADSEEEGGVKRLYLIFHAVEIAALLWGASAVFKNVFVFAAALGYSVHLFMDLKFNHQVKPMAYFLLWRMKHGFSTASLLK